MRSFLTVIHTYFKLWDSGFLSGKCSHEALLLAFFTIYQSALL